MTQDKKKYWEGFDGEEDNDEEDNDEEDFGEEDDNKDPSSLISDDLMGKIVKKGEDKKEEILNDAEKKRAETCKNAKKGKDFFFAAAFIPWVLMLIFLIILFSYVVTRWIFWVRGHKIFRSKIGVLNFFIFLIVFGVYIGISIPIVIILFKFHKEISKLTESATNAGNEGQSVLLIIIMNLLNKISFILVAICLFCMFAMPSMGFFNVVFLRGILKWCLGRGGAIAPRSIEEWINQKLDKIKDKIDKGEDAFNTLPAATDQEKAAKKEYDKLRNELKQQKEALKQAMGSEMGNMFGDIDEAKADVDAAKESKNQGAKRKAKLENEVLKKQTAIKNSNRAKGGLKKEINKLLKGGTYLELDNPSQVNNVFKRIINQIKDHPLFGGDIMKVEPMLLEDKDNLDEEIKKIKKLSHWRSAYSFYFKGGDPATDPTNPPPLDEKNILENPTSVAKIADALQKKFLRNNNDRWSLCCLDYKPTSKLTKLFSYIALIVFIITLVITGMPFIPEPFGSLFGIFGSLGAMFVFMGVFFFEFSIGNGGIGGFGGGNVYGPMYYKEGEGLKVNTEGICGPCKIVWPAVWWLSMGKTIGKPNASIAVYISVICVFAAAICWFVWFFSCFGWLEGEEKKDKEQEETRKNVNNAPILKAMGNEKLITKMNEKVLEDENLDENAKNKYDFNKYLSLVRKWRKDVLAKKKLIEEADPTSDEEKVQKANAEFEKGLAEWILLTPDKEQTREPTPSDIASFVYKTELKKKYHDWETNGYKVGDNNQFENMSMFNYFKQHYQKIKQNRNTFIDSMRQFLGTKK